MDGCNIEKARAERLNVKLFLSILRRNEKEKLISVAVLRYCLIFDCSGVEVSRVSLSGQFQCPMPFCSYINGGAFFLVTKEYFSIEKYFYDEIRWV